MKLFARRRILTLVIRNDVRASQRSHRLYRNGHQNTMLEKSPDFSVRRNLPLHLILDLRLHECKLLMYLLRRQVSSDLYKLESGFLHLTISDQLSWRVRHKSQETNAENDTEWDLEPKRQAPLCWSVWCVAAGKSYPVTHHCPERDAATRDASN